MGLKRCKLKDSVQRKLLEFFVAEVTARTAADLMGIQVNTAALFYRKIRMIIAEQLEAESGEIELDESYFGGTRKGKRGRGAAGKVLVFGNHSKLFTNGRNHINGIENYWNQAKRVLRKYNGIPEKQFYWFLKETEFRFNYGSHKEL